MDILVNFCLVVPGTTIISVEGFQEGSLAFVGNRGVEPVVSFFMRRTVESENQIPSVWNEVFTGRLFSFLTDLVTVDGQFPFRVIFEHLVVVIF